jgi:predicted phage baseplate assembly protein
MATPERARLGTVGRQPVVDYVTKDYEGFKQAMLGQIPVLLPNWTDRSESDFGVVLIELFAYVADILSYYQDRVANEAFLATATQRRSVTELLRLIDYQIDPGLAAAAHIHVDLTADLTVLAASLPYQLRTAGRPGEPDVVFEITREFTAKLLNNAIDLSAVAALPASSTSIVLDRAAHALAEGDAVYFEQATTQPDGTLRLRRSPMLTVTGIRPLADGTDEVDWLPPLPEPFQTARTTLKGNNVLATHGKTVADEPVFVSDGTPGQRFALSRSPVTHLLRQEQRRRRRSAPELEVRVDGVLWEEVESLLASGPADLHYTTSIDENDVTTVTFGTGARGSVPPAGGRVQARYRIGLGSDGNVGSDALTVSLTSLPEVKAVSNPFAAEGGADRESTEEAKISGPGSVIAQERAVTLEDYELLAEGFPGVGKAKARVGLRGGYKVVQVFIAPEDPGTVPPPPPSGELRSGLQEHLEARMPVNRMAGVDVLDPVYVPVDVVVDVHVKADANRSRVVQAVQELLRELLSFARQDFGKPIRVGEVFSALYPVEGVDFVLLRRLERRGRPAPDECGFADIPIAEHELAFEGLLTVNAFGGLR